MEAIRNWLHRTRINLTAWLRSFSYGRYGSDGLNIAILCTALMLSLISALIPGAIFSSILYLLGTGLLVWALFRSFSKNTYKRYEENRKFRLFFTRLRDREHRYYNCPACRQPVRVPRGKGKIAITCPSCGEKFIRKS